jgi:hypothetical protein
MAEKDVDYTLLRSAIKELNGSGLLENPIKMVGVSKKVMINAFVKDVEKLAKEGMTDDLPENVYDFFNDLADILAKTDDDEPVKKTKDEEPIKEEPVKKAAKDEKPIKEEPAEKKEPVSAEYKAARKALMKAGITARKIDSIEFIHKAVKEDPKITQKEMIKQLTARKMMTEGDFVDSVMARAAG